MKIWKLFLNPNTIIVFIIIIAGIFVYCKYKKNSSYFETFLSSLTKNSQDKKDTIKISNKDELIESIFNVLSGNEKKTNLSETPKKKFYRHEEKCREVFESLFQKPFPNTKPDWLINPLTSYRLELDGYNPDIITPIGKGLAFERDGEQHSIKNHIFNSGSKYNTFEYQFFKDHQKDKICREKRVVLIRIPHNIPLDNIENFIKKQLSIYKIEYNNK